MENLELHAAAIVAIPALIMLARHLAAVLPGRRALYANIAGQMLVAVAIAIGMDASALDAGELATAGALGIGQIIASWSMVEGIKKAGGETGRQLVKGKTGTGDGRQ